jgi:outer membrane protein TolC
MRHYAWSAALVFSVVSALMPVARADTLSIPFSELESYARERSSRAEILRHQLELVSAERDDALAWSNPVVAFDREDAGLAENQWTLEKSFEPPWAYRKSRSAWDARIAGAQNEWEHQTRLLLADLKSRYIELWLLRDHLAKVEELEAIVPDVSRIITARREEGHLSAVDEQLVRMTMASVHRARQSVIDAHTVSNADWRSLLGIDPELPILLTTPVTMTFVDTDAARASITPLDQHPGVQALSQRADYLHIQAGAAKGRFIPSINVYGGYKEIDPDESGYVVGLSLGIPLFHRNNAAARQFTIQGKIAAREADAFRIRAMSRVNSLTNAIAKAQESLRAVGDITSGTGVADGLLQSYVDGWITLHELLNAIQITTTGLGDYYAQKTRYYQYIFELESITGTSLVEFAPEER